MLNKKSSNVQIGNKLAKKGLEEIGNILNGNGKVMYL
jgi:hypothetical protein